MKQKPAIEFLKDLKLVRPEYEKDYHIIWERSVPQLNQKLVVAALRDTEVNKDFPFPHVIVYEDSKIKHAHVQSATNARVFMDSFQKIEGSNSSIFECSMEQRFYFHLVRAFRDGSNFLSFSSDSGEARWRSFPYPPVQKESFIVSAYTHILRALRTARALNSKPLGSECDEVVRRLGSYWANIRNLKRKGEIAMLVIAAATREGFVQHLKGTSQEEAELIAECRLMREALKGFLILSKKVDIQKCVEHAKKLEALIKEKGGA